MKFIIWTLFLSAAAVFVIVILVGMSTGREYRLNRDPDNPRNAGQTDVTLNRDNVGAVMWLGVIGIILSFGAIRNWREIMRPTSFDREENK
ncbi:MAG: hypothetical protein F9K46_17740 [Anaerolineae bacterium]|nr:MAG: hypothetical protein F9K46_17740 [Anaerolineae bacterium]